MIVTGLLYLFPMTISAADDKVTCSLPVLPPLLTGEVTPPVPGKGMCPFCPAGELHVDGSFSCQEYDGSRDSAEQGHSSDPCRA